ncbi:cupredoxin superfamily protein [Striga asiatica]|uniref:Cupredoxin superfamily protein n=1 Tax=Striga asiatica TaxID=4170 RepID=A0A5A7R0W3_STRAF|nr:cupredoxin superfamily protein [Striga asiatica]
MGLNLNFFVLFLGSSVVAIGMGSNIWPWGGGSGFGSESWCPCAGKEPDPNARTIEVGGSDGWNYGVNYTGWFLKNWPFFVGDTLVFKYPSHHSLSLLKDWSSYLNCSMEGSTLIGSTTAGGGEGFKVTLQPTPYPYFFVCPEKNGIHCSAGQMKFAIWPFPRLQHQ